MKCVFILALIIGSALTVFGQCPDVMPAGTVCLSQAAANQAAANVRELEAVKAKITVLEDAMKLKDASIEDLKAVNARNVADLTERMHRTEVSLAEKTGTLIACEAGQVRNMAIIDGLLKKRQVKVGLINF
jgi:hypothetical protein